jgi:carbon storage regulator
VERSEYEVVVNGEVNGVPRDQDHLGMARRVKMLVLSRKVSQQIMLGSEISITVVKVEGNHVRLGIKAPPDVTILRAELDVIPNERPDRPTKRRRRVPV